MSNSPHPQQVPLNPLTPLHMVSIILSGLFSQEGWSPRSPEAERLRRLNLGGGERPPVELESLPSVDRGMPPEWRATPGGGYHSI